MMPSRERLLELFEYDALSGILRNRVDRARAHAGAVAGHTLTSGNSYLVPSVDGARILTHRAIWVMIHGDLPSTDKVIDHIDGNKSNNVLTNLRLAFRAENRANARVNLNNTSGYRGVTLKKSLNKFAARCKVGGKYRHLGYFDTPEAASQIAAAERVRIWGEFSVTAGSL